MIPETIFMVRRAPVHRIRRGRHARRGRTHWWVLETRTFELTYDSWESARTASALLLVDGQFIPPDGLVNARRK